MIRYNAAHRGAETDIVPHTDRLGIPVVAHSALRWGALMKATPDDPPGFVPPPAPAWYRFALQSPSVAVVLAAPESREELDEDLTVLDVKGPLASEEYERLAENGRRVRRQRGRFRARIAVGQPSSLRQGSIRPRHFRGKEAEVLADLQLHPVDLGQLQQLAIFLARPTHLRNGMDIVAGRLLPPPARHALVKQDSHGRPASAWRVRERLRPARG
jgi:hypothetical protein